MQSIQKEVSHLKPYSYPDDTASPSFHDENPNLVTSIACNILESQDPTASPRSPSPHRMTHRLSSLLFPPQPNEIGSPLLSSQPLDSVPRLNMTKSPVASLDAPLPSTPTSPSDHIPEPGKSPLETPKKRFIIPRTPGGTISAKKCFSPNTQQQLKKYQNEGRQVIYSLKGESDDTSFRYTGVSQRPLQRVTQHVNAIKKPRGTSALTQVEQKVQNDPKAKFSIGILAVAKTLTYDPELEEKTIAKCKRVYHNVINQRKGGGGGVAMQEHTTMPNGEAERLFKKLLKKIKPQKHTFKKIQATGKKDHIILSLSKKERTQKKVIYIFERTLPTLEEKRLIGFTTRTIGKRVSEHLSYTNNVEQCPRKNANFYRDLSQFSDQFTLQIIPVEELTNKGASLEQLETIAIRIFKGLQGYNKNKGGGGCVARQ